MNANSSLHLAQFQTCRASNPTKSGSDFVDDALVQPPLDGPRLFECLQAEPGMAALAASRADGALTGFVCLRLHREHGFSGVEVHIWLDRSLARLPDLLAREHCASLPAAAQFLEQFDPTADQWRDPDTAQEAAGYDARVGRRTRETLVRARFAALVGEALSQAL